MIYECTDHLLQRLHMHQLDTYRTCRSCGFVGYMDPWNKSVVAQCAAVILLLLGVIPGLLFVLWSSRKLKCPGCGKVRN